MGTFNVGHQTPIYLRPDSDNIRIGKTRPSMKKNELLQKIEVEKPKARCRDLPGYGFTYGVPSQQDGGVAEVLNGWASVKTKPYQCNVPSHKVKNFVGMNRSAASLGLTSSRDQESFRRLHTMLKTDHPAIRGPRPKSSKPFEEYTFGRKIIPHAPMFEILQNKFQNDFIEDKLLQISRDVQLFVPKRVSLAEEKDVVPKKKVKVEKEVEEEEEIEIIVPPPKIYGKIPAAIFSFRTQYERNMAFNRKLARLEAEKRHNKEKAKERRLRNYLSRNISSREKQLDVKRRTIPPKIYSMYSCIANLDEGQIAFKKATSRPCPGEFVPWRPIYV